MVKSLHDGMKARVLDQGSFSATFNVSNGVKQGCVLAPTLFSIMFSMLIRDAFHETDDAGIYLKYRTDGGIFNLRRLRAKTKVAQTLIRELLFADDNICRTIYVVKKHRYTALVTQSPVKVSY